MTQTPKRTAPLSWRIDPKLRAKLEAMAEAENRKLGNMIDTLVREACRARDRQKEAA